MSELKKKIEALLFATDSPLSVARLREAAQAQSSEAVQQAIQELKSEYESSGRSFSIHELAGGFQLLTRPQFVECIARLKAPREIKLTQATTETLSIIAYKQPITRAEVESIRGVQSGQIIRTLMDMGLVRIAGRKEELGKPLLYGTSKRFLELLGLNSLEDLPKPEEIFPPSQQARSKETEKQRSEEDKSKIANQKSEGRSPFKCEL